MNDPLPHELVQPAPAGTYLINPFNDWAEGEGVPILTGTCIDLLAADVKPWARFDTKGAICTLDGRCDFLTVLLYEIAAGKAMAPSRHLSEEVYYVLSGTGQTDIESDSGERTIDWGPRAFFSIPMNARYTHRNTGDSPARIVAFNDMRYLMSLYRSEEFIFSNPMSFPERQPSEAETLRGKSGQRLRASAHADLATLELPAASNREAAFLPLEMDNGSIGPDLRELAVGTHTSAIRQFHGMHLIGVSGNGYTLSSEDGSNGLTRMDWHHGIVAAAPSMAYYQHFNVGNEPARFLTLQMGSVIYPMFRHRRHDYGDGAVYAAGYAKLAKSEQSAEIFDGWKKELASKGIAPAS